MENKKANLKKQKKKDKNHEKYIKVVEILLRLDRTVSREEAINCTIRYLYEIKMKDNQELDTIVVDKYSKTIFHFETKVQSSDDTLKSNVKTACGQIKKGYHLIQNVLTFGVHLPGWSIVSIVCLPMLENKAQLENCGIEERFLKFFLTKEELETVDCMLELQKEVTSEDTEIENQYANLMSWMIGSLHCTIDCQTFNFAADFDQVTKDITGNWKEPDVDGQDKLDISNCCRKCSTAIPSMVSIRVFTQQKTIIFMT